MKTGDNETPFTEYYLTNEAVKIFNLFDQDKVHALIALDLMETAAPEHQKNIYRLIADRVRYFKS